MSSEDIIDTLEDMDENILLADGLEEALIGYVECAGMPTRALYDSNKCVQILVEQGMTHEEAMEHFLINVQGAYVGEYTPAFATMLTEEE